MCAFLPMFVDGSMVWQLHRRQAATDAALLCTAQRLGSEIDNRARREVNFFTRSAKGCYEKFTLFTRG